MITPPFKSRLLFVGFSVLIMSCGDQDKYISDVTQVPIITSDIDLFYATLDRMERDGYYESIVQTDYFDKGSDGLKALIEKDGLNARDFMMYMKEHAPFFASIRPHILDKTKYVALTERVLKEFDALLPDSKYQPVFFLIGQNRHGGTLTDAGFTIELQKNVLGLPNIEWGAFDSLHFLPHRDLDYMIAHEQVHVTQPFVPLSQSLLRMTLNEGIADYVALKLADKKGNHSAYTYGDQHYNQLKEEWLSDLDAPISDVRSKWIWNWGANMERPNDLAYYIGFKIAESYCLNQTNHAEAIRQLVFTQDYEQVFRESGFAE